VHWLSITHTCQILPLAEFELNIHGLFKHILPTNSAAALAEFGYSSNSANGRIWWQNLVAEFGIKTAREQNPVR
jgi:hypothetical protein